MAKSPDDIKQQLNRFTEDSEIFQSKPPQEVDLGPPRPHHGDMTSITREELDSKLDAVRADGRATAAEMKAQMSDLRADVTAKSSQMETQFHQLRADITTLVSGIGQSVARMEGKVEGVEGKIDGLKSSIGMLQFVIATVAAIAGLWIAYEQLHMAQTAPAPAPAPPTATAPSSIIIQVPSAAPAAQPTQPTQPTTK